MDNKNGISFEEDLFDLASFKKAAKEASRKKTDIKRSKMKISLGKAFLTIAALAAFIVLFFAAMHYLGFGVF